MLTKEGHKFQLMKDLLFSARDAITLRLGCLDFVFVTGPPKYSDSHSKDGDGALLCASPFVTLSRSYNKHILRMGSDRWGPRSSEEGADLHEATSAVGTFQLRFQNVHPKRYLLSHQNLLPVFPQMRLVLFLSKRVSEWLMVSLRNLCDSTSDFTSVCCWYLDYSSLT